MKTLVDVLKMLEPNAVESTEPERHSVSIDSYEQYDDDPNSEGCLPCIVIGSYKDKRYVIVEVDVLDIA